jgi:hypothetical protein
VEKAYAAIELLKRNETISCWDEAMKEIAEKVKLSKPFDVDKITIHTDRYFPNAYTIDLPLDSMPDHVWQYIFEQKWKSSRHLWDRKLFVIGDKLRLVTTVDEFRDKLDWIEQVIDETNNAVDEYKRAVLMEGERRIEEELDKQTLWEEKTRIEMIKAVLRKIYT